MYARCNYYLFSPASSETCGKIGKAVTDCHQLCIIDPLGVLTLARTSIRGPLIYLHQAFSP